MALRAAKQNIFYTVVELEVEVPQTDVIALVSDAKVADLKRAVSVSDSHDTSYDSHQKVSVTVKSYKVTKTLASNFIPDEIDAEDDESDHEEIAHSSSESRSVSKSRKTKVVKKITGTKKSGAGSIKTKRSKKGQNTSEEETKSKKTTKAGKKKVEKYKKGKYNPFVTIRDTMEQLENPSQTPNLDQSIRNNNRELIRAAVIGSQKLYKAVAYSKR